MTTPTPETEIPTDAPSADALPPLTAKQALFVCEYLIDANATQAAIRAGYSEHSARAIGSENLAKPAVIAALAAAMAARVERVELNADWVLRRLKENVERAMQAEPVRDRFGQETGEFVYEGAVANRALELLGKHVGLFSDRVEHSGPNGAPIAHAVHVTHRVVDPATEPDAA